MSAGLCPCGCGTPVPPGRMFADPHRVHIGRWRRGQAWLRALWERNQPAILAGHARRAHAASERQANERLTAAESALWRRARLIGQENGRAKANARDRHRFGVRTQQARAGAIGGRKDAPVKHRRAYLRALGIIGLTPTARTRDLWSRSYLAGYAGSYDARLARLRARKASDGRMSLGYITRIEPTCVVEPDPGEAGPSRPMTAADRARLSQETLQALEALRAGRFPLMPLAGRA